MSHQTGRMVSEVLNRHFGEIVEKVGYDLFTYGAKPIGMICKTTELPRIKVIESLRTLLKFDMVTFEPSKNEVVADYKLVPDNVMLLIRYPRYLFQIKSKFGDEAELIVEELLQRGSCTAARLLVTIAGKCKDDKEKNITLSSLKDTFISLATAAYIQQAPVAETGPAPVADTGPGTATHTQGPEEPRSEAAVPALVAVATIVPDLDVRTLMLHMNDGTDVNDNSYWRVNFDRFHQDFRDDIMIKAMTRRIDENAGELMRHLLQQMYLRSSPWAPASNPIPALELKQSAKLSSAAHPLLQQHLDHYLRVIEENGCGFVQRSGDAAGGQYTVHLQHAAEETVCALLEHTVTERLGSKAARIFRLIRARKYIEEEDIQKHAMLPNKECKQLTYRLMEEHFVSVQPMRKPGATAGGLVKAIYLYYINIHELANTARELISRSLHNVCLRARTARAAHRRALDKRRRVRSIVHGMRARGEPQQHIDDVEETVTPAERLLLASVERQLKQLSAAEIQLDGALFLVQWHLMYRAT